MNKFIAIVLISALFSQSILSNEPSPPTCENAGWVKDDKPGATVFGGFATVVVAGMGAIALRQPGHVLPSMGAGFIFVSPLFLLLACASSQGYRFDLTEYLFCWIHENGMPNEMVSSRDAGTEVYSPGAACEQGWIKDERPLQTWVQGFASVLFVVSGGSGIYFGQKLYGAGYIGLGLLWAYPAYQSSQGWYYKFRDLDCHPLGKFALKLFSGILAGGSGYLAVQFGKGATQEWREYRDWGHRYRNPWNHRSTAGICLCLGSLSALLGYLSLPGWESVTEALSSIATPLRAVVVTTYEMVPSVNTTLEALSDIAGRIATQTPRVEVVWPAMPELNISSIAWLAGGCVAMIYVVRKFHRFEQSLADIQERLDSGKAQGQIDGEDCAICRDPTVAEGLACGHRFHPSCIVGWALTGRESGRTCPVCRAAMVQ